MKGSLYNFKTGAYEQAKIDAITDEQARCYIPQDESVQGLYEVYRGMGNSIIESIVLISEAFVKAKKGIA